MPLRASGDLPETFLCLSAFNVREVAHEKSDSELAGQRLEPLERKSWVPSWGPCGPPAVSGQSSVPCHANYVRAMQAAKMLISGHKHDSHMTMLLTVYVTAFPFPGHGFDEGRRNPRQGARIQTVRITTLRDQ